MRMPKIGNEQRSVKPKVRALLTKYQWFWWGNSSGFGKTGISDTCAFKAGVFLAVESKFGYNKATARQIGFLVSINTESGFAFVVNEKNIDQLEVFLKHFGEAAAMVQQGKKPGAETGGPLIDAIRALTDYPKTVEEFAEQQAAKRAKGEQVEDNDYLEEEGNDD